MCRGPKGLTTDDRRMLTLTRKDVLLRTLLQVGVPTWCRLLTYLFLRSDNGIRPGTLVVRLRPETTSDIETNRRKERDKIEGLIKHPNRTLRRDVRVLRGSVREVTLWGRPCFPFSNHVTFLSFPWSYRFRVIHFPSHNPLAPFLLSSSVEFLLIHPTHFSNLR